jgi:hypothetical protein
VKLAAVEQRAVTLVIDGAIGWHMQHDALDFTALGQGSIAHRSLAMQSNMNAKAIT